MNTLRSPNRLCAALPAPTTLENALGEDVNRRRSRLEVANAAEASAVEASMDVGQRVGGRQP
jgi:hypothetical protein